MDETSLVLRKRSLEQVASSPPISLFRAPQFLSVVGLGFVMPMGGSATPSWLNDHRIAIVFAAISIVAGLLSLFEPKAQSPDSVLSRVTVLVLSYSALLFIATFTRALPETRLFLFALCLIGYAAFFCIERRMPGSWVRVVYTVGALHVGWACIFGDRTRIASGVDRLSGGTSPVLLGFESAGVIILSLLFLRMGAVGRRRYLLYLMSALSTYTLFAAFSRAAIISLVGGLIAYAVYMSGRSISVKAGYALIAIGLAYFVAWPLVVSFLGGDDPASVLNASGRYDIWPRLLASADQPFRGFGFAALYDGDGPDWYLYELNDHLPSENSLLQAYLMGGLSAALVWVALLFRCWRSLVTVRFLTGGLSVSFGLLISIDAMYGIGQSGESYSWWWLLACVSLHRSVAVSHRLKESSASLS